MANIPPITNKKAKIITIAQTKGGASKSTLAFFIYQYLHGLGFKVALYDGDEQQTLTQLNKRFNKGLNLITPKDGFGDHSLKELHSFEHYQFIIADTPPYRSNKQADLMQQSSFVLVPFKPSILDAMASESILSDIKKIDGLQAAAILTQVRAGVSFTNQIRDYISKMGFDVLNTEMRQRVAYSRGVLYSSLSEEGDKKALKEIADITTEIMTMITSGKEGANHV